MAEEADMRALTGKMDDRIGIRKMGGGGGGRRKIEFQRLAEKVNDEL
jgi:hypothetical protein